MNKDILTMPRHRSTIKRSEEEKRNLKGDLRRIPEWEIELESIRNRFRRFDLNRVSAAASLIHTIREIFLRDPLEEAMEEMGKVETLEHWKKTLTIDRLVRLSNDYSVPSFLRSGVRKNIVDEIRSGLKQAEKKLAEFRSKGTTDSFWVSLFTSKVNAGTVRRWEQTKNEYLALSRKIPAFEDALRILTEVRNESSAYASRVSQIEERLSLAREKKAAVERFETKHGKAFAKAAVADNLTRSRATSLKRLVKKTKDCPYCGSELGMNPHLDHIYPVDKGGLSIVDNLVWCCSTCNSIKANKGLTQFLGERGVPIEQVLSKLSFLGKHV